MSLGTEILAISLIIIRSLCLGVSVVSVPGESHA